MRDGVNVLPYGAVMEETEANATEMGECRKFHEFVCGDKLIHFGMFALFFLAFCFETGSQKLGGLGWP